MPVVVSMPKLGFDMAEGTLARWVVAVGQSVEKGAILAEIETDKATVEVESAYSGVVLQHLVQQGTPVPVGDPIAVIGQPGETVSPGAGAPVSVETPALGAVEVAVEKAPAAEATLIAGTPAPAILVEAGRLPGGVRASPVARRMAEERGIDLSQVKGTGPGGRITRTDIQAYQATPSVVEARLPSPAPVVIQAGAPADQRVQISRLRGIIGRRMVESVQQAPQFFVTHEYDVADLLDLRTQVNAMLPEEEKTSVNDYVVKAVALALREFPNLNARLDEKANEIIRLGQVNVGIAVAVENGLLTVVIRATDQKSVRQIASESRAMVNRAREGKVRPDDIEGSTFSVSNLGMFDVEHFTAILNPPEAAILAVGAARQVPVVKDGEVRPGWRMTATITIDHRVSDGAEAARFLQALGKYLEAPLRLLI